jgi:hypothetical protein
VRAKLPRAGRWRIGVSFDGSAGWASRRLPPRFISVPRQ